MPLKGREELGVYESRLRVFELLSHVSCQSEVRILTEVRSNHSRVYEQPYLVDCARNEAWYIGLFAEHVRETIRK
jgi:uncharacterized membrane protein